MTTTPQLSRKMTFYTLSLTVALGALSFACGGSADTPAAPLSAAEARTLLQKARATSAALTSHHASQTLGEAAIEADLGVGAISANVTRSDGTKWRYIAAGDKEVASGDDGASWNDDKVHGGVLFSQVISGPLQVMPKIFADPNARVEFVAHEAVDGTQAAHVRFAFAGKGEPIDVWVVDDPRLGPYIKRLKNIVALTDGDFPSDVKYSKLNVPVAIAIPR
jgi:hypothetical protein